LLPLHLACERGLSREIISALLHADEDSKKTVRILTKAGKLALHFALESKLDVNIIGDLLEADTSLNVETDFNTDDDDIYQIYHDMNPLIFACCIGAHADIVCLLLEKDRKNHTIFETLQEDHARHSGTIRMRPLHIALSMNSVETTRIILQYETRAPKNAIERECLATQVDVNERTVLHLACMHNMEPEIIRILLNLDPSRVSTTMQDCEKCTPLHLLCAHEEVEIDTCRMLLDAESEYFARNDDELEKKSISKINVNKENPLSVAILAGAPNKILELLLQPENFDMTNMGKGTETKLASRVTSHLPLQRAINRTLSQRNLFIWLFFTLLINVVALVAFSIVIYPNQSYEKSKSPEFMSFIVLAFCCAAFCAKELFQISSQKSRYFLDPYNLFDVINLLALTMALQEVKENYHDGSQWTYETKFWVGLAGVLLAVHALYTLRSIFLPFAQFARGTEQIFITLIPFFVTSFIALQTFAHTFSVYYRNRDCTKINDDRCEACQDHINKCMYSVFHGFFDGPQNTESLFDVAFGIVVVIVLLNVVVAIVR
jgi:ankyrin repeat protein